MDKDIKTYLDKLSNVCQQIYKKIRRAVKRYEFWLLVAFFSGVVLTLGISGAFASEEKSPTEKSFKSQPEQYIRAVSASARIAPTTTTTTVPKKRVAEAATRDNPNPATTVPSGDWVAQCKAWGLQGGIELTDDAITLIGRESKCDVNATNPSSGACSIPQALPCSKLGDARYDPVKALQWMASYVNSRYGGWTQAKLHSDRTGWY